MRLQRYLSDVGFCSRRDAENFIKAGKILVNGKKAILGDKVSGKETIIVDGRKLQVKEPSKKKIIVFNKPGKVECTMTKSPWRRTLVDFDFGPDRVFPIGRLDYESHGLLLLTNDGELGNILAHSSGHEEEYLLTIKETPDLEAIARLKQGILHGNDRIVVPDGVELLRDNILKCIFRIGKTKHIRKICAAVGLEITDLQRSRIGFIELGELGAGKWKMLDDAEYRAIKQNGLGTRPAQRRKVVQAQR